MRSEAHVPRRKRNGGGTALIPDRPGDFGDVGRKAQAVAKRERCKRDIGDGHRVDVLSRYYPVRAVAQPGDALTRPARVADALEMPKHHDGSSAEGLALSSWMLTCTLQGELTSGVRMRE